MVESDQRINIEYSPEGNSIQSHYPIEQTSQSSIVTHSNVLSSQATPHEVVTDKRSHHRITTLVSLFDVGNSKKSKKHSEEKQKPKREDEIISHIEQNNSSSKFKLTNIGKSFHRQNALDSSERNNSHKKIKDFPKKHTLDGFQHQTNLHCVPEYTSESIAQAITTEPTIGHSTLHPILEPKNESLVNYSPQNSEEIYPCKNQSIDNNQLVGLLNRLTEQESLIKDLCLKMTEFELKTNALLEVNKVLSQDLSDVKRELEQVKTTIPFKQAGTRNNEQVGESTVKAIVSTKKFKEIMHRDSKTFDVIPITNDEELIPNKMKLIKKADSQDW